MTNLKLRTKLSNSKTIRTSIVCRKWLHQIVQYKKVVNQYKSVNSKIVETQTPKVETQTSKSQKET